jgi:hypothetical protein
MDIGKRQGGNLYCRVSFLFYSFFVMLNKDDILSFFPGLSRYSSEESQHVCFILASMRTECIEYTRDNPFYLQLRQTAEISAQPCLQSLLRFLINFSKIAVLREN